jgi:hypothetical protein
MRERETLDVNEEKKIQQKFYKNKLLMSEKFSHRVQSFVIGFTKREQLD